MYNFGEKNQEKNKQGKMVDVWKMPKYEQSKKKAIEIIEKYDGVNDGDFWILKNETKTGTVMYSGLIISHNACLKINDSLSKKDQFKPECVSVDKNGYDNSLVFTYCCPEQGIYEVGEASPKNCKQAYPYAMAFKRCYDRVVLKTSKLAYDGIYSESESDTFTREETPQEKKLGSSRHFKEPDGTVEKEMSNLDELVTKSQAQTVMKMADEYGISRSKILNYYKVEQFTDLTKGQYGDALNRIKAEGEKK